MNQELPDGQAGFKKAEEPEVKLPISIGSDKIKRIPKKSNAKERPNYRTIVLISHANKVMLKILQVRLQQYAK